MWMTVSFKTIQIGDGEEDDDDDDDDIPKQIR